MQRHIYDGSYDLRKPALAAEFFIQRAEREHPVSRFHKRWFYSMAKQLCLQRWLELEKYDRQGALREKALSKLTAAERAALGFSKK